MEDKYELDGVSNIFPALGGHIFRFSAILNEKIHMDILKRAFAYLRPYFPIIYSHLEKNFFGYCHVPSTDLDVISMGNPYLNKPDLVNTNKPSIRIYVYENRFSVDFFHGNADGRMAYRFVIKLIEIYCLMLDNKPMPKLDIPPKCDLLDPYKQYYEKVKPSSFKEDKSYMLRLNTENNNFHRYSTFVISVDDIKKYTKEYGYSVNDFLCATLYNAIYNGTDAKNQDKPITISAGIDLRPYFNSNTQRNFVYYCNARLHKECANNLPFTMKKIKEQIENAKKTDNIKAGISSVYSVAYNPVIKFVPRAIKDFTIKRVYHLVSDGGITATLSNVGYEKLSDNSLKHLDHIETYLGVFKGRMNATAVGFGDKVSLCLTFDSKDKNIDEEIIKLLKENHIEFTKYDMEYN